MIVKPRIEIDDQTRRILAHLANPTIRKSALASHKDVCAFVDGCIAALENYGSSVPTHESVKSPYKKLMDYVHLERARGDPRLKGKCDSFVIGWCKIKHSEQLRSTA